MLTQKKTRNAGRYVDINHVNTLISNYKKERWVQNSKKIDKADSLSVWYGIEELKEFITNAEKNGADGIKMCFGVYSKEIVKNEMPELEGRQTVVLMATKEKENEDGSTFDKSIFVDTEKGPQILAFNMTSACPPLCGGGVPKPTDGSVDWDNIGITLIDGAEGMVIV